MKIRFQDPFLHSMAIGAILLLLFVGGPASLFYALVLGICIDQLRINAKEKE